MGLYFQQDEGAFMGVSCIHGDRTGAEGWDRVQGGCLIVQHMEQFLSEISLESLMSRDLKVYDSCSWSKFAKLGDRCYHAPDSSNFTFEEQSPPHPRVSYKLKAIFYGIDRF